MSPAESEVKARSILDDLIRQRQRMRAESADSGELEANRLGIIYWQWQLNRALKARGTGAV
jgi:hypothetical protein